MKTWLAALLISVAATPALAGISEVDVGYNDIYTQTAPGTVNYSNSFFGARLNMVTAGDYSSATVTYDGGGSTSTLTPESPGSTTLFYGSNYYPSEGAMFADFPTGLYQFAAGSDNAVLTVTNTPFAAVPVFTNFAALSSIDPTHDFDVKLSGFSKPDPSVTDAFTFLTIYDSTAGKYVYDAGFNSPGTTDFVIAANTLTAGHSYSAEAIYSDRIGGYDKDNAVSTNQLFDNRTDALFSIPSAAPEPSGWALMLAGVGIAGAALRTRRRTVAA